MALDTIEPCDVLGGETITLTCTGIFDSNVKLGTLKVGEIERVVNLQYVNETTLTFVAPPISWIKQTKYLETAEDEDVEIHEPEDVQQPEEVKNTEEKAEDEEKELTKEEKMEATIKKAKIESVEYAEQMFKKHYYVNHNENVSVGFTLNNIEWYWYRDYSITYKNPVLFTLFEGTGVPEGDIVYPDEAMNDEEKRKEFVVEKFKSYIDK